MKANLKIWLLILGSFLVVMHIPTAESVTTDDINNSVMVLIRSYAVLDNKLERHEQRERALGEILKKSLVTLQRGQREIETLKGGFDRLEERIGQVETFLIAKEKTNEMQQVKIAEALGSIYKWMVENAGAKDEIASRFAASESSEENDLTKKIDELNINLKDLHNEIAEIKDKTVSNDEATQKLFETTKRLFDANMNSTNNYISKIDDKLNNFYITGPSATEAPRNLDWEIKIQSALDNIENNLSATKKVDPIQVVIDRKFIDEIGNNTRTIIERASTQILESSDKNFAKTASRIKELGELFGSSMKDVTAKISNWVQNSEMIVSSASNSDGSFDMSALKSELALLNSLNTSIQETAANILDTKKRLEFGIHQIVLEVSDSVRENLKELGSNFDKKINEVDNTLNENHADLIANMSTKVETEIGQVWRQVGIMFQEITTTRTNLDKVLQYSESYVNSTTLSINGVEIYVAGIAARVEEMHQNVNYLLGRLSLVNQEFNELKSGLGAAIENLKGSLKIVKDNIVTGPGPHNITDTDHVISKRNSMKRGGAPVKRN